MSGPEPVSPKPSVGQVMVWWGTASPAPGDGSTPEEVLPKPSSGQLMVWHCLDYITDGGWSVGSIRWG